MKRFIKLATLMSVVALAGCGDDEVPGENGISSLVSTTAEPAGDNCTNGGTRLDIGPDTNGDGVLDAEEITDTEFTCSGEDGDDGAGSLTLVSTTAEAAGANCADGGQRVDFGIDDNGDGVLDSAEIDGTTFVCDGATGGDGQTSLIATAAEAAGGNCITGGIRVDAGVDTSDDGVLDAGEITSTSFACNGLQSLSVASAVDAGGVCGTETGSQIDLGLDLNNDGTLDAGEITTTAVSCDGADGFEALIAQTIIAPGGACGTASGVQIDSGIDADRSGVLDAGEIAATNNLCNGEDGANGAPGSDGLVSLILLTAEAAGDNCSAGGTRIDAGVDTDSSGVLDGGEITDTGFACNALAAGIGLFGVDGGNGVRTGGDGTGGNIYTIDETTGVGTVIAPVAVVISAMDFDATGTLFGITDAKNLVTINTTDGSLTTIGAVATTNTSMDMSFDPVLGTMFATDSSGASQFYSVDLATGALVTLGTSLSYCSGGLAVRADGTHFLGNRCAAGGSILRTTSPVDGTETANLGAIIQTNSMAFFNGQLLGIGGRDACANPIVSACAPRDLVLIDETNGTSTVIGAGGGLSNRLSAIAGR